VTHKTGEEPFLVWLKQLADTEDVPLVHSVSYGDQEPDLPKAYTDRVNYEFMKMGVRGLTILFASGDDGAAGHNVREDPKLCAVSSPGYPASSPYVTAVGGTQLSARSTPLCDGFYQSCDHFDEVACSADIGGVITTGGGFSTYYDAPYYQKKALKYYFDNSPDALPNITGYYNPYGRGFPDISAYSVNYAVVMSGGISRIAGTSASTPAFGAMVALWNDLRLQKDLPPLGFINPLLYQIAEKYPEAFNDIVMGDNRCGVDGSGCCEHGFKAARGWDATTGLGSPKFEILAKIFSDPALYNN